MSKFDLDHPKVKLGQIELKLTQKFKIQVQSLNFSKSISSDREWNSGNFDIKFVPRFDSNQPKKSNWNQNWA